MTYYKGFSIWHNGVTGTWWVQYGYKIVADYKTITAAKSAITQKWVKIYQE